MLLAFISVKLLNTDDSAIAAWFSALNRSSSYRRPWYQNVARSRPPKDQTWHHVRVDGAKHSADLAERDLLSSPDHSQISYPLLAPVF